MQLTTVLHRLGWRRGLPAAAWPAALPGAAQVGERTLAATGSPQAAQEMTAVWAHLTSPERAAVLDPPRHLARAGRQADATTCGSAVLAMLAAVGDPTLALWLATGRLLEATRPPELAGAPSGTLTALAAVPPHARFAPLQRVLKHRSTAGALLGLPWPASLGTPPWGAARAARFPGVGFHHLPLDDTDALHLASVLDAAGRALAAGVPVPVYSGGDVRRGASTAVPRHVVLVTGRTDDGYVVWEPGAGRRVTVSRTELVSGRPQPALGGWSHLAWALLPVPRT